MRVLIVTPWYPTADAPESGVFVAREAAALSQDHDVRVLHLDWSGRAGGGSFAEPASVVGRRVPLRRLNPVDYARARRLVRRAGQESDVVHTHALTGLVPWLVGRPGPAGVPWVHSEHWSALTSPGTLTWPLRVARAILLPVLRRPDVAIAESGRLAAALKRLRHGPVAIVPCIVPPVRDIVERPGGALHLVGVGGLIDRKDPLLAVDALAELRRRGRPAHLTWVGDGPLREAVLARARERGVDPDVTLTGVLDSTGVSRVLDRSHLLLLPTKADNFCVAVAEALIHGRPVVSGSETGAVDYAVPSVSRFVSARTASAYADAVEALLASTAELTAVQIAATVADRFTPDAVRRALEGVYAELGVSDE